MMQLSNKFSAFLMTIKHCNIKFCKNGIEKKLIPKRNFKLFKIMFKNGNYKCNKSKNKARIIVKTISQMQKMKKS